MAKKNNTWSVSESKAYFDKNNCNVLILEGPEKGQSKSIVIPPGKNRVDLIDFHGICRFRLKKDYDPVNILGFKGLVVMSSQKTRRVFYGPEMVAETKI